MKKSFLSLLLISGLTIATQAATSAKQTEPEKTIATEKATIHLYRTKSWYWSGYKLKVFVDGNKIKLKNKEYQQFELEAGTTEISIKDIGKATLPLELKAGKDYYVQTYLKRSFIWAMPQLAEVTESFGKQEIDALQKKKSDN